MAEFIFSRDLNKILFFCLTHFKNSVPAGVAAVVLVDRHGVHLPQLVHQPKLKKRKQIGIT
jgi:hypothetical protein